MHRYVTPDSVRERVLRAQGKAHALDVIDASRSALVVIDMQNHYVAEGFPAATPAARQIVPAINRMAAAMRAAGATVVWVKTVATGALEKWGNHHAHKLTREGSERRLASLAESSAGARLYPELDASPDDIVVHKIKYSALITDSSGLDSTLRRNRIDTLLIAGTKTNVCCESTARDASMMEYRVVMLSDALGTSTDEEHAHTLNTFQIYFGDVMETPTAIARLRSTATAPG